MWASKSKAVRHPEANVFIKVRAARSHASDAPASSCCPDHLVQSSRSVARHDRRRGTPAWLATSLRHPAAPCTQNLEKDITTRVLHDTFVAFGAIVSCKIALDNLNKSKGYGFVQFELVESADQAIDAVNGMTLGDSSKVVTVCRFVDRSARERNDDQKQQRHFTNLYVKNLPERVNTQEDLEQVHQARQLCHCRRVTLCAA